MVDTTDLKSVAFGRAGSSPAGGTIPRSKRADTCLVCKRISPVWISGAIISICSKELAYLQNIFGPEEEPEQ